MSRTLAEIALENESRPLLGRLKVRQKYLPRKVESQNKAGARAEEWFESLPKDLPEDESLKSTKSKKKPKKKTATKKSAKRVTKKPKKKEYVHPEQSVEEILEDTGADWVQVAMGVARELRIQGHACGHLESQASAYDWSTQPAEVELRIVEGLIDYLETSSGVVRHSPDFRSVWWHGEEFTFSQSQAEAVKILYEAWVKKTPEVSQEFILAQIKSDAERLRDLFKDSTGMHPAWGKMIVKGKKGAYRFNDPE
jgi:hypothetical protein